MPAVITYLFLKFLKITLLGQSLDDSLLPFVSVFGNGESKDQENFLFLIDTWYQRKITTLWMRKMQALSHPPSLLN